MHIAYLNANLKVGHDGMTRVVYKMIGGALERGHEAIAITSTLPVEKERIVPNIPRAVYSASDAKSIPPGNAGLSIVLMNSQDLNRISLI